jgi:hypothetical protein
MFCEIMMKLQSLYNTTKEKMVGNNALKQRALDEIHPTQRKMTLKKT